MIKKINLFFSFSVNKIMSLSELGKEENSFIVLCYHRVLSELDKTSFIPSMINATPKVFEEEINYLKNNFNIISPEEILHSRKLSKKSLLITFDDGYKDNYINAFPILKKYNIPSLIFLTADFIDNHNGLMWVDKLAYVIDKTKQGSITIPGLRKYDISSSYKKEKVKIAIMEYLKNINVSRMHDTIGTLCKKLEVDIKKDVSKDLYLSSGEILEMSKGGVIFGSHGCSHSILMKIGLNKIQSEIVESKAKIERITGKEVDFFAYPNGNAKDFDNTIIRILQRAGYEAAFTMLVGKNKKTEKLDLFKLKRIPAGKSLIDLRRNILLYA